MTPRQKAAAVSCREALVLLLENNVTTQALGAVIRGASHEVEVCDLVFNLHLIERVEVLAREARTVLGLPARGA